MVHELYDNFDLLDLSFEHSCLYLLELRLRPVEEFDAIERLIQRQRYMPVTRLDLAHEDLKPDLSLDLLVDL